jgi:hypothetical protein
MPQIPGSQRPRAGRCPSRRLQLNPGSTRPVGQQGPPDRSRARPATTSNGRTPTTTGCCASWRPHLVERAWVTLLRQWSDELRDLDAIPISVPASKVIVAENFTVPEVVRRCRRTKRRKGKAPQEVLEARSGSLTQDDKRGDLPLRPASSSTLTRAKETSRNHLTSAW